MQVDIMVTAGANQAFTNVVLTLCDADDQVVLFKPYYFNHLMAIQMTGGEQNVLYGPAGGGLKPDLDWLEETLKGRKPPRMVVIVNPCNPAGSSPLLLKQSQLEARFQGDQSTVQAMLLLLPKFKQALSVVSAQCIRLQVLNAGFVLTKTELERAAALTEAAGCWLVMDNTYEHFTYGGVEHACVSGRNVINIFSFSKAYGMMGWRVGYICYPDASVHATLGSELLKVQVCAGPCMRRQRALHTSSTAMRAFVGLYLCCVASSLACCSAVCRGAAGVADENATDENVADEEAVLTQPGVMSCPISVRKVTLCFSV